MGPKCTKCNNGVLRQTISQQNKTCYEQCSSCSEKFDEKPIATMLEEVEEIFTKVGLIK